MKNRLIILALLSLLISSCSLPAYVPETKNIGREKNGGHLILYHMQGNNEVKSYGELIAVDENKIILLNDLTKICEEVDISDITEYKLHFAVGRSDVIPFFFVNTLLSFSHGFFALVSLPINITLSSIMTASVYNDYMHRDLRFSYDELAMYARFPQGFPEGLSLEDVE